MKLTTLKRKADKIFSIYIRKRDTDYRGWGKCITCGKPVMFEDGDAGHFVSRKHLKTRYDPRNVHLQCRKENRFESGNQATYLRKLEDKFGREVVDELMEAQHTPHKLTQADYLDIINKYGGENEN